MMICLPTFEMRAFRWRMEALIPRLMEVERLIALEGWCHESERMDEGAVNRSKRLNLESKRGVHFPRDEEENPEVPASHPDKGIANDTHFPQSFL